MRYAQIRSMDISNGEGVGVALFVQGCHFKCKNCFNQETWDFNDGKTWESKIENKFFELINKPFINRISILGGEPLAEENIDNVLNLINKIRVLFPKKRIWLYSGYTWNQIMYPIVTDDLNAERDRMIQNRIEIVSQCDVLIDGQFVDELKDITLKWRGSSNQRVIDVKKSLHQNKVILYCD